MQSQPSPIANTYTMHLDGRTLRPSPLQVRDDRAEAGAKLDRWRPTKVGMAYTLHTDTAYHRREPGLVRDARLLKTRDGKVVNYFFSGQSASGMRHLPGGSRIRRYIGLSGACQAEGDTRVHSIYQSLDHVWADVQSIDKRFDYTIHPVSFVPSQRLPKRSNVHKSVFGIGDEYWRLKEGPAELRTMEPRIGARRYFDDVHFFAHVDQASRYTGIYDHAFEEDGTRGVVVTESSETTAGRSMCNDAKHFSFASTLPHPEADSSNEYDFFADEHSFKRVMAADINFDWDYPVGASAEQRAELDAIVDDTFQTSYLMDAGFEGYMESYAHELLGRVVPSHHNAVCDVTFWMPVACSVKRRDALARMIGVEDTTEFRHLHGTIWRVQRYTMMFKTRGGNRGGRSHPSDYIDFATLRTDYAVAGESYLSCHRPSAGVVFEEHGMAVSVHSGGDYVLDHVSKRCDPRQDPNGMLHGDAFSALLDTAYVRSILVRAGEPALQCPQLMSHETYEEYRYARVSQRLYELAVVEFEISLRSIYDAVVSPSFDESRIIGIVASIMRRHRARPGNERPGLHSMFWNPMSREADKGYSMVVISGANALSTDELKRRMRAMTGREQLTHYTPYGYVPPVGKPAVQGVIEDVEGIGYTEFLEVITPEHWYVHLSAPIGATGGRVAGNTDQCCVGCAAIRLYMMLSTYLTDSASDDMFLGDMVDEGLEGQEAYRYVKCFGCNCMRDRTASCVECLEIVHEPLPVPSEEMLDEDFVIDRD